MTTQRVTHGFEHYGGARDGEGVPSYRILDLVITPDSFSA
jgi:hypothetical protein